jgi:riboflavin transporter FmnP
MSEIETPDVNLTKDHEVYMAPKTRLTLEIVGAAIFGALSLVLSLYIVPILPRTPEGLAYFDPVSLIWVSCFLVFGPRSGILCCIIGTLSLFPFDPFTPIGPLMKFAATFALIIIPILILKLYKREGSELNSQKLKTPINYIFTGVLGTITRIIVMVYLNIVVYLWLIGPQGLLQYLIVVVFINALTSLWDLGIPYAIVFGTKLDQWLEIW